MKLPRVLALCLAVAGLTACFGDSTRVPTLAVTALLPVDAALDVDVESPIAVTFTKPVKPDSVAAAALVVSRARSRPMARRWSSRPTPRSPRAPATRSRYFAVSGILRAMP